MYVVHPKSGYVHIVEEFSLIGKGLHKYTSLSIIIISRSDDQFKYNNDIRD